MLLAIFRAPQDPYCQVLTVTHEQHVGCTPSDGKNKELKRTLRTWDLCEGLVQEAHEQHVWHIASDGKINENRFKWYEYVQNQPIHFITGRCDCDHKMACQQSNFREESVSKRMTGIKE